MSFMKTLETFLVKLDEFLINAVVVIIGAGIGGVVLLVVLSVLAEFLS